MPYGLKPEVRKKHIVWNAGQHTSCALHQKVRGWQEETFLSEPLMLTPSPFQRHQASLFLICHRRQFLYFLKTYCKFSSKPKYHVAFIRTQHVRSKAWQASTTICNSLHFFPKFQIWLKNSSPLFLIRK